MVLPEALRLGGIRQNDCAELHTVHIDLLHGDGAEIILAGSKQHCLPHMCTGMCTDPIGDEQSAVCVGLARMPCCDLVCQPQKKKLTPKAIMELLNCQPVVELVSLLGGSLNLIEPKRTINNTNNEKNYLRLCR
jgi:hypothetical protein